MGKLRFLLSGIFFCFGVFGGATAIPLLKALAQITGAAEARLFCHFCNTQLALEQKLGRSLQTNVANEKAGRLVQKGDQFSVQAGAVHAQIATQLFYRIAG